MNRRSDSGSRDWFDPSPVYAGRATAEFVSPRGFVEGPATVRFSESGEAQVEMTVERFHSERPLRGGALEFFHDGTLTEVDGAWSLGFGTEDNPCERLVVHDSNGVFVAEGDILHYENINGVSNDPIGTSVRFSLVRSQFEVQGAGTARYWVLPLLNFVSTFVWGTSPVDQHPLRIRSVPSIPEGVSEDEARRRQLFAQLGNQLILFDYGGSHGFIEPLPDAKLLMEQLRTGQQSRVITAVVVGELGAPGLPSADLSLWPPVGMLPLLSLATGAEVGAPWVEVRDATGALVKRLHTRFLANSYTKGRGVIPNVIPQAIGNLLSVAFRSPHYSAAPFRIALLNWRRAGQTGSIDERLRGLFTALESLLSYHGLRATRLRDSLAPEYRTAIDSAISEASAKIGKLAMQAASQEMLGDHETLRRIENRLMNAANVDADFGIRVTYLTRQYGLADPEVIDRHILQNPRTDDCKAWSDVLSMYRGFVVHEGFLDVRTSVDLDEAYRIARHLQDVLARVLLKMAGYDGQYQPTMVIGTAPTEVDWVKPTSTVADLGLA